MYLGIDVGGTKTLVAVFTNSGKLVESSKFATPKDYPLFVGALHNTITSLSHASFVACGLALPGRVDRSRGIGEVFGNLPWKNVPVAHDVQGIVSAPVYIENDTKLGGLSEASYIKGEFKKVLYITISTGISAGLIIDGSIDPDFADSESGHMVLEYKGKPQTWESFASGKAIVQKYGKRASDIHNKNDWKDIAHGIAIGTIDLIAIIQPDVIVFGGGVGAHFSKFKEPLLNELKKYEMPLVPIPPIRGAKRAEEAVIYGCYLLAKQNHA